MSFVADGGGDPYQASTDFEKYGHAAMLDMIQHADPGHVTALGNKLSSIGTKTETIATDLQTHMSKVDWEGKGGDAFRDWGSRVASATATLSAYSSNAGVFMLNAGQVLGEVQRDIPKVPALAYHTVNAYRAQNGLAGPYSDTAGVGTTHLDGASGPYTSNPTEAQYKSAQTSLEKSRLAAVDQMNKLGQAYNMATDVINTSTEPTFPPTPTTIMPARPPAIIDSSSVYVPGDTGGGSSTTSRTVHIAQGSMDSGDLDEIATSSTSTIGQLPPDAKVTLDSVGTLPPTTTTTPLPAFPDGPVPVPTVPGPTGTPPLLPTGLLPGLSGGTSEMDPQTLSAARSAMQREAQGLSEGMSPYGPTSRQGPMSRGLPASRIGGLGAEPPPGNSMITGGRATQRLSAFGGEEPSAIPQATVIGGGAGQGGRGPGGVWSATGGGGGAARSFREDLPGERLFRGREGSLGDVPSASGPQAGRSFTPGGEGLGSRAEEPFEGGPGPTGYRDGPLTGRDGRERERRHRRKWRWGRLEHAQDAGHPDGPAGHDQV